MMAGKDIRFDGRVVLVTGAGNGLGKAYALAFAERGASVVVNDLGGDRFGSGSNQRTADVVVSEIKSKGGKAVANYDSVEDGEKLVQTALENFGRIDIVVNNAGILRDKSFTRISNDDWDLIHRIHLRGSFLVTRAAWPHMRKQGFGRVIMIASAAGIYGNFGQANYSAAKLGLAGLSNTLAIEGAKHNILCNTVAPVAGSRLTETVLPPDIVKALKPEFVAPLIVYLSHDDCSETGGLFEVGAGWFGKLRWERTSGAYLRNGDEKLTAENVRDNWSQITDFSSSSHPTSIRDSTGFMMEFLMKEEENRKEAVVPTNSNDPVAKAKAFQTKPTKFTYTEKDSILYSLGVGVSTQQDDYLKFLFELSDDFSVLPTFSVIPAFESIVEIMKMGGLPDFKIDPTKILHGEQYMELTKPLPRSGTLTSKLTIADILDKKSGAVILYNVDTYDEKGEKIAFNQMSTFVVGHGNFGGRKNSSATIPLAEIPNRPCDAVVAEKTSVDQAALYRLNGDHNPLHIDPSFAAMGGFKTPILHGLCSFGYSVRHVMKTYANNDMSRFKAVKVRFAKPVLPGQTLETSMWKQGNKILFLTKVKETGAICINGAYVELTDAQIPTQKSSSELKSLAMFKQLGAALPSKPELTSKVNAIYQWNITQNGKTAATWIVDLKSGKAGQVYEGESKSGKPDCTITVSDENFSLLVSGKLNPQQAFLGGKLKLSGNIMLAQKLGDLFSLSAKL